jgi:WD40 repeat protein
VFLKEMNLVILSRVRSLVSCLRVIDQPPLGQVWDFSSGEMLYSVTLRGGGFSILAYLTDEDSLRMVVGGGNDGCPLVVIDHATRSRLLNPLPMPHTGRITHIFEVPLPDKTVLVTTSTDNDGTIRLWDRGDFSLLDTITVKKPTGIYTVIWGAVPYFPPDGRALLVITDGWGRILLYDLSEKTCIGSFDPPVAEETPISLDTYTTAGGEGGRLVVGTDRGGVRLHSLPGLAFLRTLVAVGGKVRSVHVFDAPSDGRCLVAAGSDNDRVTIADTGDYRAPRADPTGRPHVRSAVKTG